MRLEEISRSQVFLRGALISCFAGFAVALVTGGDRIAFWVCTVGCAGNVVGAGWMLSIVRVPEKYSARRIFAPAMVIAFGAFGGVYYWGVASPVAAMITYGIYFFSLGSNAALITAMYGLVAVLHAALAYAIIGGVIVDRGNISMGHARLIDQIGVVGVIEFLYFITFYTARVSQWVTLEAVQHLEQAVRGVRA